MKVSKAGLVKVGPHTDPYTSKSGDVMAARAAKRNSDERKTELRNAQIHRRRIIEESNSCIRDQRLQKDRDQRVLRQLVTIEDVDHALPHELLATLERICAMRTPPAFKKG